MEVDDVIADLVQVLAFDHRMVKFVAQRLELSIE
jgi:hypothetical protein